MCGVSPDFGRNGHHVLTTLEFNTYFGYRLGRPYKLHLHSFTSPPLILPHPPQYSPPQPSPTALPNILMYGTNDLTLGASFEEPCVTFSTKAYVEDRTQKYLFGGMFINCYGPVVTTLDSGSAVVGSNPAQSISMFVGLTCKFGVQWEIGILNTRVRVRPSPWRIEPQTGQKHAARS